MQKWQTRERNSENIIEGFNRALSTFNIPDRIERYTEEQLNVLRQIIKLTNWKCLEIGCSGIARCHNNSTNQIIYSHKE